MPSKDDPDPESFKAMAESLEQAKERIKKLQEKYDLLSQAFLARGTGDLTQIVGELAGRTSYKEAPPIVAGDMRYELTLRERVEQAIFRNPMAVASIAEHLDESVGRVAAVIRILKSENAIINTGDDERPAWALRPSRKVSRRRSSK